MPRYSEDLLNEAKKLGHSAEDLNKYYNHGLLSWHTHKESIPGTTPEQLGMALVEEFILSEKARVNTIRKDLIVEQEQEIVGLKKPSQLKRKTTVEGDLYNEEFLDALPDDEVIVEWATSEKILSSYEKRYGKDAPQKLLEAANLFVRKSEWSPSEEPASESRRGSKRHSWDMKTWHESKLEEAKEQNIQEAIEYHSEKIEEYNKKIKK
jgi:hypothetical protein